VRALLAATRQDASAARGGVSASDLAALRLACGSGLLRLLGSSAPTAPEAHAASAASALSSEFPAFSSAVDVSELVDAALDAFETNAPLSCLALDPLPQALAAIRALGDGYDAGILVSDLCRGVVDRICRHPWPTASISRILAALKELPL
jgi:hypothetical protein